MNGTQKWLDNVITEEKVMATYKEIQEYIRKEKGYVAQTC